MQCGTCKGHDARKSMAADTYVCAAADAGQRVPAAVHAGGHDGRGAVCGRRGAGVAGRGGLAQLAGAGHTHRVCAGLFDTYEPELRRGRTGRAAQKRRHVHSIVGNNSGGDAGGQPDIPRADAEIAQHARKRAARLDTLFEDILQRHTDNHGLQPAVEYAARAGRRAHAA